MTVLDAVECLDGHAILSAESARKVCQALGVTFDETLVMTWQTVEEAQRTYGFFATVAPGDGVEGLDLSYHVAKALGIEEPPGRAYSGVGRQAQVNQQAIRQELSRRGKL